MSCSVLYKLARTTLTATIHDDKDEGDRTLASTGGASFSGGFVTLDNTGKKIQHTISEYDSDSVDDSRCVSMEVRMAMLTREVTEPGQIRISRILKEVEWTMNHGMFFLKEFISDLSP